MADHRLKSIAQHVAGNSGLPHPFDPLTNAEIEKAVQIVRREHENLYFNAVTLQEPRKKEMLLWVENPRQTPIPNRQAEVVAIEKGGKVYDGIVDLKESKITKWQVLEGEQPLVRLWFSSLDAPNTDIARSQWRTFRLWSKSAGLIPR